jgi:hypothetical protein
MSRVLRDLLQSSGRDVSGVIRPFDRAAATRFYLSVEVASREIDDESRVCQITENGRVLGEFQVETSWDEEVATRAIAGHVADIIEDEIGPWPNCPAHLRRMAPQRNQGMASWWCPGKGGHYYRRVGEYGA